MTTTTAKPYTKKEIVKYFFSMGYIPDEAFILPKGQKDYFLFQYDQESELERMMSRKEITNYITFEHVLSTISEIDNFWNEKQLNAIANEIEVF